MSVDDDGISFTELIGAVKRAVKKTNMSIGDTQRDLRVTEVTVSTVVFAKGSAGAGVELTVPGVGLKIGGKLARTRANAQRVVVTLVPPAPGEEIEVRGGNIEGSLTDAIAAIRTALAAAAGGDDPFVLKTSTVTLDFVVTESGSIKIVGEGEAEDQVTQSVTLTIGPPL
ncbi:trypco2 family protein [Actinoplanes sp. ATCC 53533]|uniref:trypco2 family protein n=1 Tax=Actinoplanes sp. ATCC 53533 TaxID=1288362 RepID=UPI000F7A68F4|nr:trypco2 family protein [Actinoplanes sp. ATCC 53533]